MDLIEVKKNQSLADIAIEHYGKLDCIFELVKDNTNLQGITDNVYEGDTLYINPALVSKRITAMLPAEGVATLDADIRAQGLGFWQIGIDFIVQ